ncbi:MAG TPA: polysaccharide deacetylase family protein [Candidatus Saccharimonadaceae bacterium]|jgi:peptidoglycan/xylan/chitin deacetylase (PgdA/CDA1 family)|nr:polysaccharide deacetylase family protein [Candidatus Saccharimonadaceae bacterium]
MTLLHTRRFSSWARGHLVCRVENVLDRFALTFDDGPNPGATPRILDALARRGAFATFFVLAPNVRRHPHLIRRMRGEGHEVAAHGDRHWPLPLLPPPLIRREVLRCSAAVCAAGGLRPVLYRPPFGFMMPGQSGYVGRLGFTSVLGDVYPEDAQNPGVERIVRRVASRLAGGSILILHDGSPLRGIERQQTVDALELILDDATRSGLRAVTVTELLEAERESSGARP